MDGAANSHVIEFFAKKLGVQKSKITIVSGEKSRHKTLRVDGVSLAEAVDLFGIPP